MSGDLERRPLSEAERARVVSAFARWLETDYSQHYRDWVNHRLDLAEARDRNSRNERHVSR